MYLNSADHQSDYLHLILLNLAADDKCDNH